jgi:predicted Zn-dependent protease
MAPIDAETERSLGSGVAIEAHVRIGKRHPSDALQRYVNLVGRSVARYGPRPELPYAFAVLENETPNAFAGPGGYIFITTGTLQAMDNEAELAAVLAHEVAHVTCKHMLQTYRRSAFVSALQQSAAALDQNVAQYSRLVDAAANTLFERGLDQRMEYEADVVGTEIAVLAGYDPRGMVRFLQKLKGMTTAQGGWFKTHPSLETRIDRLNALLATELAGEQGMTQTERFQKTVSASL